MMNKNIKFIILIFAFCFFMNGFCAELTQEDWDKYAKTVDLSVKSGWKVSPFSKIFRIIISFDILKNGEFQNITVLQSSGNEFEDNKAIKAIESKSGMFPLPEEYDGDSINIKLTFNSAILGSKIDAMKAKYNDNLWFNPWGAF